MPPESTVAAAQPSTTERLKSALFGQPAPSGSTAQGEHLAADEAAPDSEQADPRASIARPPQQQARGETPQDTDDESAEPATREDGGEADDVAVTDDEPSDDEALTELQLSTVKDLADATGLDLEKIQDLTLPVKVDGKDGTASLRDLLRSYQLGEHINQKLATLDNDRKAFESKRGESERAAADRLLKLDAGLQTLQRALLADFGAVDWDTLRTSDPVKFNSQYVAYQQRNAQLQEIAQQIGQEKQQFQQAQETRVKAWLEDQKKLLKAKIPEWSDDTRRAQDKASILEYLKGHGISKEEFEQIGDHRQALVVRDAWKWHELQKSKPATLKKVKAAPKLLKPGTKQSRESRQAAQVNQDRARLRQTGKVRDAVPQLKRALFGTAQR